MARSVREAAAAKKEQLAREVAAAKKEQLAREVAAAAEKERLAREAAAEQLAREAAAEQLAREVAAAAEKERLAREAAKVESDRLAGIMKISQQLLLQAVDKTENYVREADRKGLIQLKQTYMQNHEAWTGDHKVSHDNLLKFQKIITKVDKLLESSQQTDREYNDLFNKIKRLDTDIKTAVNLQINPTNVKSQIDRLIELTRQFENTLTSIDKLPVGKNFSTKNVDVIAKLRTDLNAKVQTLQIYQTKVVEFVRLHKTLETTVNMPAQPGVTDEILLNTIQTLLGQYNTLIADLNAFPNAIQISNVYGREIVAQNTLVSSTLAVRQKKRHNFDSFKAAYTKLSTAFAAARNGPAADLSYGVPRPMTETEQQDLKQDFAAYRAAYNQMDPIDQRYVQSSFNNNVKGVRALLDKDEEHILHEENELNLEREHAEKGNKLPAPIERVDAQPLRTVVTSADRPKPTFRGMELSSGMKFLGAPKRRPVQYITGSTTVTGGADTEIDTFIEALSVQEGTEKLKTMGKLSGRLYVVVPSKETAENPEKLANLRRAVAQNQHYGAPQSSKLNASGNSSLNGTGQLWQVSYPDPNSANKHFIPSLVDTINSAIY